jgi:hypothetical protein
MGKFTLPHWRQISFSANAISLAHPELLKFFPANSLDCLKFAGLKSRFAVPIDYIMRQQNLSVLDLSATAVNERDLKAISGLRKLLILNIDTTKISHKALFDSKLLLRLEGVGLLNLRDCTPVLQSLLLSKRLNSLALTSSKLKKSDFAIIAQMSRLTSLDLSGTDIDDNDLKQLTMLRNVRVLNLFATHITKKSVPTLRRFPALHAPALPPEVGAVYFGAL